MEKYRREARLSFPSGHASLASYGMIYGVLYLQWQASVPRYLQHLQLYCTVVQYLQWQTFVPRYLQHLNLYCTVVQYLQGQACTDSEKIWNNLQKLPILTKNIKNGNFWRFFRFF